MAPHFGTYHWSKNTVQRYQNTVQNYKITFDTPFLTTPIGVALKRLLSLFPFLSFSFFMYNACSSTLFLALGGHYVCSNGCCLFVVSFQELIRLKIIAFLVSFPFMTKFCSSWLGVHDGFLFLSFYFLFTANSLSSPTYCSIP